jgi:hypothetical protein
MSDYQLKLECTACALQVRSVPEIFDLFYQSERVLSDLAHGLAAGNTQFTLALRQWESRIQYHLEFRSFICQNQLAAISQSDDRSFYRDIAENKELILNAIGICFEEKIRPAFEGKGVLPHDSYVADFGIVFSEQDGRVNGAEAILIEINRFNREAGASRFDWTEDLEVLTGTKPFEFRVTSQEQFADCNWSQAWAAEELMHEIKLEIFRRRKSWFEKWVLWWRKE